MVSDWLMSIGVHDHSSSAIDITPRSDRCTYYKRSVLLGSYCRNHITYRSGILHIAVINDLVFVVTFIGLRYLHAKFSTAVGREYIIYLNPKAAVCIKHEVYFCAGDALTVCGGEPSVNNIRFVDRYLRRGSERERGWLPCRCISYNFTVSCSRVFTSRCCNNIRHAERQYRYNQ